MIRRITTASLASTDGTITHYGIYEANLHFNLSGQPFIDLNSNTRFLTTITKDRRRDGRWSNDELAQRYLEMARPYADAAIITITKLPRIRGPINKGPIPILRSIITEAGGQLPDDLATMYPSESGQLELHFENEILSRVRTTHGQYLFDAGTRQPDYQSFMRLLREQFDVRVLREKLDGHSPEGRKAGCLGPILAITLIDDPTQAIVDHGDEMLSYEEGGQQVAEIARTSNDIELPQFIFVGDDDQLDAMETACKEINLPIVRQGRYLGFVATDEIKFKAALIWIFDKRVNGWWLQQNALIEHNVCTNAQFEAAYYAALAAQTES